jgi:hypothetical protein
VCVCVQEREREKKESVMVLDVMTILSQWNVKREREREKATIGREGERGKKDR